MNSAANMTGRVLLVATACFLLVLSAALPLAPVGRGATTQTLSGQDCLMSTGVPPLANVRVAAIIPILTSSPYYFYPAASFYGFYRAHAGANGNVSDGLSNLSTELQNNPPNSFGWGTDYSIKEFLNSTFARGCGLQIGANVKLLTDVDVDQGGLFGSTGTRQFDAVIVGHEEYVTAAEFSALKTFVSTGGRLVMLDGDSFTVQVKVSGGEETLVAGHGWRYNGQTAWRSAYEPFNASKIDFVGSAYCCFHKFTAHHVALNLSNPLGKALDQYYGATAFSYNASREQDRLLNRTGTSVVATFVDKPGHYIAAFVHRYHSGYVIAYGAYGSDAVGLDPSVEYFVVGALTADLSKISLSLPSNGVQPIGGSPGAEVVGSLAVIGGTLLVIAYLVVRSERKSGSVSAGDYV